MRQPLDGFKVDYGRRHMNQTFTSVKARRIPKYLAPASIKPFFEWTDSKKGRNYGAMFADLFSAEVDLVDGDMWHLDRFLGRGGFGAAGLFQKLGSELEVIDEVVIKSTAMVPHAQVNDKKPDLAREAAIMAQTNARNTDSMLYLRQFKSYPPEEQYRFYLENCEYGDIDRLILRYKAWQHYIPEYFAWHLLLCLAEGANTFATGPYFSYYSKSWGMLLDDGYLLHADIKPSNIFLGTKPQASSSNRVSMYPVPRFADFGLSTITQNKDYQHNTARSQQRGTRIFYPPELRYHDIKPNPNFYPFNGGGLPPYHDKGGHRITPAANIFAIGAVMWMLITGKDIDSLYDRATTVLSGRRSVLHDGHLIPPILTGRIPEYDQDLLDLVRDCLKFLPANRPSPSELYQRTLAGVTACSGRVQRSHKEDPEKTFVHNHLYCKENEIQGLPRGNANFNLDQAFWDSFVSHTIWLPQEWGTLHPPDAPLDLKPSYKWPRALRDRFYKNLSVTRHKRRAEAFATTADEVDRDLEGIGATSFETQNRRPKRTKR